MKLINMTCPNCGATLVVDADNKKATCEHCGATVLIDDEVKQINIQYSNAEEDGYRFEKGRIRAQREASKQTGSYNSYSQNSLPQGKKRKTWLWVLGWIFIFPVPLTILMLRKKDLKPAIRYGIIAAGWIIYLIIGSSSGGNSNKATPVEQHSLSTESSVSSEPSIEEGLSTESDIASDSSTLNHISVESSSAVEQSSEELVKDGVVNNFIRTYNLHSTSPLSDIQKGNIRTKYYAFSYGYYLELLHSDATDKIFVSISETNENADIGVSGMRDVFHDIVMTIEPELSDEEVYNYFDNLVTGEYLKENDTFSSMLITYVPDKDLSSGHSRGRIDIDAQ